MGDQQAEINPETPEKTPENGPEIVKLDLEEVESAAEQLAEAVERGEVNQVEATVAAQDLSDEVRRLRSRVDAMEQEAGKRLRGLTARLSKLETFASRAEKVVEGATGKGVVGRLMGLADLATFGEGE